MTSAVRVTGLVKRFGDATAVDGIDLNIEAGTFFTLLGPSGCGKTTTLRMIAGLEHPDRGEIRVGESVVNSVDDAVFVPPESRKMGMVFQSYAVWPHMTVYQNVAFPLHSLKVPRREIPARVMQTLELVNLAEFAKRPAPLLSGGQQQRVALARALVANPEVLLLDEPLSNLDARLREQMRLEIRRMQVRLGITTVFVTHDQDEAMTLSDEIAVMRQGSIEQLGIPREVYERPRTKYVMDFLGHVNNLPATVSVTGGSAFADVAGQRLAVDLDDDFGDGDSVTVAFRSESVEVVGEDGHLKGTIIASAYAGGYPMCSIQIGDSLVQARAPQGAELDEGSEAEIRILPGGMRIWRSEAAR